ncbi:DivIVA domain-containing protein [Ornithinimicrobium ciconiae]|uniref:DivIVA domain-containing protein n=1 Tax=Ornithinimicrobium ciconiae TaxID=2594265 RepID=UPI001D19862B|nr:DivIVA domain-containing protein [Ornithinimicrobium ciconiae]
MILILVIVGVLALGLLAAAVVLRTGAPGVPDPVTSQFFEPLPRGGLQPDQVIEVRFDQAIRGYRMSQVDEVLDRLAEELRDRDAEIARLRAEQPLEAEESVGGGGFERVIRSEPDVPPAALDEPERPESAVHSEQAGER